jgi:hypothetical protein
MRGCAAERSAPCSRAPAEDGRAEVTMRRIATALAALAGLAAGAALACEDHADTAEQTQKKPAVAQKVQKQNKQQQKKKIDQKTTVAKADKG